jgi:FtsP/CotA-like multicopper oxidase with cupredoxin domain
MIGQFPGPLIQANKGDTIIVNMINSIANWSTAVHWHGILQQNNSYMDGVAGHVS